MADHPDAGSPLKSSGQDVEAMRRSFLRIQLETAMTFAQMARDATRAATSTRHHAQARDTYEAALKWAKEMAVPLDDELWQTLGALRDLLSVPGEPA